MLIPILALLAAADPAPARANAPDASTIDVDVTTTIPADAAYYGAPLVPRLGVRVFRELTPGPFVFSAGVGVEAGQSLVVGAVPLNADWQSLAYFEDGAALDGLVGVRWDAFSAGPFSVALFGFGTVGVDAGPIPAGFAMSPTAGWQAGARADLDVGFATVGALIGVEDHFIFGRPEIVGESNAFLVGVGARF